MKGKRTIDSSSGSWKQDLIEVLQYKDLLFFLVLRDIKVIYKQTVLGFAWAVIQPLASMVIFTIIFGKFAGIEDKIDERVPYAIFAYTALVPWTYFSSALSASANSLVSSAAVLNKVYFPRIIIPLTPILAKLVDFFIAFTILIVLYSFYGLVPFFNRVIYIPLLIAMMIFTASGAGMWLSALALKYRDVRFMLPFIVQILMFASPIIWPVSFIPEEYQLIYALNPVVGIIEGFREAIIGLNQMPWDFIKMGCISSTIIFISGFIYFKRKEKFFADVA